MEKSLQNAVKIMLSGTISSILIFSVSLVMCYIYKDISAANAFALYGLRTLVLFGYIALGSAAAKAINKPKSKK